MQADFRTGYRYSDRKTKARYVSLKYGAILVGRVLDVGADECHLRDHLGSADTYVGIGLGGNPDRVIDLETQPIPYERDAFDCVLCLDVLEHLDNIHDVFDELCRVSRRWVIVSLPNPWAALYRRLRYGPYRPGQVTKYYGLPPDPPLDRHKWFFSIEEAERFVQSRGAKNRMRVVQIDNEGSGAKPGPLTYLALRHLFGRRLSLRNLYAGTLWVVLEKEPPRDG